MYYVCMCSLQLSTLHDIFIFFLDPSTLRGNTLLVLCEQEIAAFDLEAPK